MTNYLLVDTNSVEKHVKKGFLVAYKHGCLDTIANAKEVFKRAFKQNQTNISYDNIMSLFDTLHNVAQEHYRYVDFENIGD